MVPVANPNPAQNQDPFPNMADLANVLPQDFNNLQPNNDYLQTYTTIRNLEQSLQYRADFMTCFEEYQRMHARMITLAQHYQEMQQAWRDRDVGNAEAVQQLQQTILREYQADRNVKAEFLYLHEKLSHIRRLVMDYEENLREQNRQNNVGGR